MSKNYDNWERLVDAVLKREQYRKLALADSRESSFNSVSSSSRIWLDSPFDEQIAAGWPSWLVTVAGEAIRGWTPRRADTFEKLAKIGEGKYSKVYKGRDLLHYKVVALKKMRFDIMDPESVKFVAREILILRRLDHPNIIKLEGLITSITSSSLYLVFEFMEHDLTGLASLPGVKFTEPQVKCYMLQLLSGLDYCHSRGVLHRDIKSSNLLIDNNGILKIADFGSASFFDKHQSLPLTSRVVTLWYRPPELLLGATHYGPAVDLWSTGCVLGELYAGKPIMPARTEVEQLHKIFKLCGSPSEDYWRKSKLPHASIFNPQTPYTRIIAEKFKDFPGAAVDLMETLLSIDPASRGTTASALESQFFTNKPLACDPSSLPKYPPSKEIDAKLREKEARRQQTSRVRGNEGHNDVIDARKLNELQAALIPDSNSEVTRSTQDGHGLRGNKTHSSGPILVQSADQTFKELEHHFQEVVPRLWNYKMRSGKDDSLEAWPLFGNPVTSRVRANGGHNDVIDARKLKELQAAPIPDSNSEVTRSTQDGHGLRGNKTHFSGPILVQSADQTFKELEYHFQEVVPRPWNGKMRAGEDDSFEAWPLFGNPVRKNPIG